MGRKYRLGSSGSTMIHVGVPNELREMLEGLIRRHGYRSLTSFVRAIIADWLAEANESRLEQYKETGRWVDSILDRTIDPILHDRERKRWAKGAGAIVPTSKDR